MTQTKDGGSTAPIELVAFRMGEQEYCVNIMAVREIRGWTPATTLPHAPHFVQGVINLRGAVLPIVDLSCRLGLGEAEPTARHVTIVVQINDMIVGLLVDAVSDILTITPEQLLPTPEVASETTREFVKGVFAMEGRMISLIELDQILPSFSREAA